MKISWPVVANQFRLLGRSAREIASEPSRGRDLGRLIATRGRSTMRLRLPWLPFALIDELRLAVGEESNVFEFGGGGSTLWFLDRGAHVVTVEHHQGWAEQLSRAVRSAKWTLLTRELTPNADRYVESVAAYPDASFDVIVVDGRERARCALAALGKVRHGGMLIFDDVDRERYAAALDAITWPRKDYIGFAPAKPSLAYTAVFTRPLSG